MRAPRILYWDLETAGLNSFKADLAKIVCFGFKFNDEKETHCLRVDQYKKWFTKSKGLNDKPLLVDALEIMKDADLLVAHFGDKFDRRFFQGRVALSGLTPPPPTKQRDTWRIARSAFAFSSNRLGNLAMALGLGEQKHQKTREEWPGWWDRSLAGDDSATQAMSEYCMQDVRTLEQIYLRIRPYDNLNHPRLFKGGCGLCGGTLKLDREAYVGLNKYPRYQCQSCGRWDRGRKAI